MSELEDECKTFRVIVHYNNEQKCEIEVNLETFNKIQSRDPEALQSLLDIYRDTTIEPAQDYICETSPVPSQEFAPLQDAHACRFWNEETENCLLEAYTKYCSCSHKWKRVEDYMRIAGYPVTAEHCRDRWRKLAKRYQTKQRHLKAGKFDVQIPELWETCFGSDTTTTEATDSNALQTLLKVYEQSRADSGSETVIKPNTHDYTFWNLESELMLLESYFRHSQESQRWKKIEDDFRRNGVIMSAGKCRDKWRRLERKYQMRQKADKTQHCAEISHLWELCFGSGSSECEPSDVVPQDTQAVQKEVDDDSDVSNENTTMSFVNAGKYVKSIVTEEQQKQAENVNGVTSQMSDQEQLQRLSSLWNEDTESWLLEAYLKHCNHSQKWTRVQKDLSKRGCALSAEQCRDKWRRLERRYHTRQKQILRSGKCLIPIPELWQKCFGVETNSQVLECDLEPDVRAKRKRIACEETDNGDASKDKQDDLTLANINSRKKGTIWTRKRKRDTKICELVDCLKSTDQMLIQLHKEHNQILRELVDLLKQDSKG